MCVCMCVCMYVHTYMHVRTYVCMKVCTYVRMYVCMYGQAHPLEFDREQIVFLCRYVYTHHSNSEFESPVYLLIPRDKMA